jgi:uncharacterized protein YcbX
MAGESLKQALLKPSGLEDDIAQIPSEVGRSIHERRFRANLILDLTAGPFAEDEWIGKRVCKRNNVYRECSSSGQSLCVASWTRSS